MGTLRGRVVLVAIGMLVAVATVDAAIGRAWDLVVVCGAAGVCVVALLIADLADRLAVPIRTDLVRWLQRTAADGDERAADVADRAVAAYRAGFIGSGPEGEHDAIA